MRPFYYYFRVVNCYHYAMKGAFIIALDHGNDKSREYLQSNESGSGVWTIDQFGAFLDERSLSVSSESLRVSLKHLPRRYWGINTGNLASCYYAELIFLCIFLILGDMATRYQCEKLDAPPKKRAAPAKKAAEDDLTKPLAEDEKGYGSGAAQLQEVGVAARDLWFWHEGVPESGAASLRGVTVDFPAATATALMGPSGAGKSTLVEALGGRIPGRTTGDIMVGGRPVEPDAFRLAAVYPMARKSSR